MCNFLKVLPVRFQERSSSRLHLVGMGVGSPLADELVSFLEAGALYGRRASPPSLPPPNVISLFGLRCCIASQGCVRIPPDCWIPPIDPLSNLHGDTEEPSVRRCRRRLNSCPQQGAALRDGPEGPPCLSRQPELICSGQSRAAGNLRQRRGGGVSNHRGGRGCEQRRLEGGGRGLEPRTTVCRLCYPCL